MMSARKPVKASGLVLDRRMLPIVQISPAKYNPRRIDAASMAGLKKSIDRFGLVQEMVVNQKPDGAFVLVSGHQRLKVIKGRGDREVPVVVVHLDDVAERALNIAMNSPHIAGEFTEDLQALLLGVQASDAVLFSELRFDELLTGVVAVERGDPDAVPDPPAVAVTQFGDMYALGAHRLICGDSTNAETVTRLMQGELAQIIFTDPPYGVDYDGGTTVREKLKGDHSTEMYEPCCKMAAKFSDDKAALYLWHAGIKGIAAAAVAAAAVAAAGYVIRCELVWNKNIAQFGALSAQYKQKHEPFYYCHKSKATPRWFGPTNEVTVWDVDRSSSNEFHPTQKPVALAERAIGNSSSPSDIALDLFGGSGSTLIACEQSGRLCRMVEIDPLYCDVIVKRWEEYTGKQAVRVPAT